MNPATMTSPLIDEVVSPAASEGSNERPVLEVSRLEPVRFEKRDDIYFVDFGKAAWGNLEITFTGAQAAEVTVRLGEKLGADGTIDREPPGSVIFREVVLQTRPGQATYWLELPTHWMHSSDPMAVAMPPEIGEVTSFRYVEIEGVQEPLTASQVNRSFVHARFNDDAGHFECSDSTLNAVWDLCKYTMKATTAFGLYIDGERERIPYEADAYINQLSHLACDFDPAVARASVAHLLAHPTWPTEWSFHIIMMVAADYETTGNRAFVEQHYSALHAKLLMDKAREDGLLRVAANIDWPKCERDNYNNGEVFPGDPDSQLGPEINTVANAFYFHTLKRMAVLAGGLEKECDKAFYEEKAQQVFEAFNLHFFDPERQIYIDGVSDANVAAEHASLHANMFALAFDLVPPDRLESVADYVVSRGMACSVYGAQYLLEGLFRAGRDKAGIELMTSHEERSWWHMIELGSTMTLEAWDEKYKDNLTWNHPWGAVPANIISRYVLGVRPLYVGYENTLIAPQPGTLDWAKGKVPTPYGPIEVSFQNGENFKLEVVIPEGITAQVKWPLRNTDDVIDARDLTPGHHVFTA